MRYLEKEGTVVYSSKDGRTNKNFPAMEWLTAMCSHIPNRGEQMVRYYGYYSNVSRGKRLIQKIYEVDPLVCPHCNGIMRIISFIEDAQVIRDILTHLSLWLVRSRPPPACAFPHADRPKMRHTITLFDQADSDSHAHAPHPQTDVSTPTPNTHGMITFNSDVLTNIITGRDG